MSDPLSNARDTMSGEEAEMQGAASAQLAAAAPEVPQTIGQRLRAAREASQLSVQDIAQSLKYSPRQIELIEADNYAALPGNTVVRGFVRSYARFLKLEPEVLVGMLEQRLPKLSPDVRPPENMGEATQPGGERQVPAIVAAAIVLAMAALLLTLWHFFGPSTLRQATSTVGSTPSQQGVSPGRPAGSVVAPTLGSVAGTASENSDRGGSAADAQKENVPPQLLFVFEGSSWVEVTDATKKTLYTGENQAGSQLRLDGQPPFDIVIGNATKVKLSYGERSIDLSPHTRAEVARLKLE